MNSLGPLLMFPSPFPCILLKGSVRFCSVYEQYLCIICPVRTRQIPNIYRTYTEQIPNMYRTNAWTASEVQLRKSPATYDEVLGIMKYAGKQFV